MSLEEKIETIAKKIYGATGVQFSDEAKKKLETYTKQVSILDVYYYDSLVSFFRVCHEYLII